MENNSMLGLEMSLNHQQNGENPNLHHHQPPYRSSPVSINEEEHHSNNLNNPATTDDSAGDAKLRKGSPWQRMKWTDNMVKLLIMIVFYVGDEAATDQPADTAAKKKSGGGGGLQKKGKWKSVSWAMMERGFYVSPQQCEDKFNDLNKRYKRVNDILGKGTACKVVENQTLLETMDRIPTKLKEEVKKLLNSKHLFFREMCAYHNSCGNASCNAGVAASGGNGGEALHLSPPVEVNTTEEDDEIDDEGEEEEEDDGFSSRKRVRAADNDGVQQFKGELSSVIQDLSKSVREKRQWMKVKMMELEEQKLGFQGELYELEKRKSKWLKFSYSKEREMDVEKIRNETMKLENERMVLMLRQKEMELVDVQQQQYSSNGYKRSSDPSSING